jgi:hypothetical protein
LFPRTCACVLIRDVFHWLLDVARRANAKQRMHAHSLASPLRMVLTGGEDRSTRFCTSAVNRSEFTRRIQSGPAPGQPEADDESRPTSARPLPGKSTRLAAGPPPAERLYVLSPDAAPVPPAPCPQAHCSERKSSTRSAKGVVLSPASASALRHASPVPSRIERRAKTGGGGQGQSRGGESTRRKWEWWMGVGSGAPPGSLLRRQSGFGLTQTGQQ